MKCKWCGKSFVNGGYWGDQYFRTILKVIKWAVIIIVFLIVWVLVEGK